MIIAINLASKLGGYIAVRKYFVYEHKHIEIHTKIYAYKEIYSQW